MMKIMTAALLALGLSACASSEGLFGLSQNEGRGEQTQNGLETLGPNETSRPDPEGIDTATDPSDAADGNPTAAKLLIKNCE